MPPTSTTGLWRSLIAETTRPRYAVGTRRMVPPAATLRWIWPLAWAAGVTRLADVTGLDWIGLPVYQAVRPASRILAVSQGKGLTRTQAKVSALMEAVEGFHAEAIGLPAVRETVGRMRRELGYDPAALPRYPAVALGDDLPLDWVPATDLSTGRPTWVPRELCELDLRVEARACVPRFRASTNGLASGNTVAEALLHGLCEVVERDACWRHDRAGLDAARAVDPATIEPRLAQRLLDRLARAGMEAQIVDVGGPTGLPAFEVWLDHPDGPARARGSGCHPSRLIALLRALTEAAQSRLTYIAGSRDDIDRRAYRDPLASAARPRAWPGAPSRSFTSAPSLRGGPLAGQVRQIVGRVRALTGMAPVAVDLARPDFDVPVVLVVAPGLGARSSL